MTSEQRVTLVHRIVFLLLLVGIAIAVWTYQKPAKKSEYEVVRTKTEAPAFERIPIKQKEEVGSSGNLVATSHVTVPEDSTGEKFDELVKKVMSPAGGVTIIHCHLPGNPASEQLADTFNQIQKKYGKFVNVTRVGFPAQPMDWQAQKGIKLPYVMMIVDNKNVFQFQGLWSYPNVDKKVAEVIAGLRRVGKDWRPVVPGMTHKSR